MTTNRVLLLVGILLSALGFYYAFRNAEPGRIFSEVLHLHLGPFLLSQLFFLVMLVLRAIRWKSLLHRLNQFSFLSVFAATTIGMMANNFLPGRMGEIVRSLYLGRREKVSGTSILANAIIERISDVLTLVLLLLIYWLFSIPSVESSAMLRRIGWVMLAGSLGLVIVLLLMSRFERKFTGVISAILKPISHSLGLRIERFFKNFVAGLKAFYSGRQFFWVMGLSLLTSFVGATSFYYMLKSFSIDIGYFPIIFVYVIASFGIALPSAPGHIGVFHGATVAALAVVGVHDANAAAAYATVLHGTRWLLVNLLGGFFALREGRRAWRGVWRTS